MLTTHHIDADAWDLATGPGLDATVRGHVDGCSRCRRALSEARELAVLLGATLPVPGRSPGLRAQIVGEAAHAAGPAGLRHRIASVAAHLDLPAPAAAEALERLSDPAAWHAVLPGFSICPIGQDRCRGFARAEPGVRFPDHRHIDAERLLVLQGSCLDSRVGWLGPGDLAVHAANTVHGFDVPRTVPLLFAFTSGGFELVDR